MTQVVKYNDYNDLDQKNIKITHHALLRTKERIRWKCKKEFEWISNIRSSLAHAKYVGVVPDDEGRDSHLYACGKVGYYVSMDKKSLVTVIPEDKTIESPVQTKILELYRKELRKLTRKESARLKKLYELEIRNKMEVATLEYKIFRSRSENAKKVYREQIEQLNIEFTEMQNEIDDIRKEKKKLSKSLVAII